MALRAFGSCRTKQCGCVERRRKLVNALFAAGGSSRVEQHVSRLAGEGARLRSVFTRDWRGTDRLCLLWASSLSESWTAASRGESRRRVCRQATSRTSDCYPYLSSRSTERPVAYHETWAEGWSLGSAAADRALLVLGVLVLPCTVFFDTKKC